MRALVSVYNKTGVVDFCKKLHEMKVEIISTGGTGKLLMENNIPFLEVSKVTNNKESFGGRMKTISFEIMSAILFRRDNPSDQAEIKELNLVPIDLVVCNLYAFDKAVKNQMSLEETTELIDVGGPTMIRSAAKNFKSVTCITDFNDYDLVASELLQNKKISDQTNKQLAQKAFSYTASYDLAIANELFKRFHNETQIQLSMDEVPLRYGENPHQKAKLSLMPNTLAQKTLANAPILQGKEISYNNYLDSDSAFKCMSELKEIFKNKSSIVIVKHGTPCGAAVAENLHTALQTAWDCDNVSAFGGIISSSEPIDEKAAQFFEDKFIEILIAPDFSAEARSIFEKKKNVRLIQLAPQKPKQKEKTLRSINGGVLIQDEDETLASELKFENVTDKTFPSNNKETLLFGQTLIKYLKSNCLMLAENKNNILKITASGVGQPNRLHCLTKLIATKIENMDISDCVLFSDAFFPFSDSIEEAHKLGIQYIVQPGGSIKDKDVIKTCNELNIAMTLTGSRHFRH